MRRERGKRTRKRERHEGRVGGKEKGMEEEKVSVDRG